MDRFNPVCVLWWCNIMKFEYVNVKVFIKSNLKNISEIQKKI